MWSRKMDASNQGKHKQVFNKNLGSASQYLVDEEQKKPAKQEKIVYYKEENLRELNEKDKANVKYNYQDFIDMFG